MARAKTTATRESLIKDLNNIIAEAEQLLKSASEDGADEAKAFKAKVQDSLNLAKERLVDLEESILETTRAAAERTKVVAQSADGYVREHPWQTIGIVAGIGVVVGLLLNRQQ